ncbi:MAG: YraN family protein [Bacteroidetes bacterium]|nr:YraN family protein [Bacteroidota bacterium]
MAKTTEIGKQGEDMAASFLREKGYRIIAQNWRSRHLEIDLIAQKNQLLLIIEVKTRKNTLFGSPQHFVSKSKQQKLLKAAHEYLLKHPEETEIRFDIIAIVTDTQNIEHIEDAFYADIKG